MFLPATACTISGQGPLNAFPLSCPFGKIHLASAVRVVDVEIRALTLTGQHHTPSAISES